ncbi:MAG: hypothetical protein JNK29_09060, partial [Anaerolineales bacterium]|nr:hypothetical protein [Anaerolineales bacterium]
MSASNTQSDKTPSGGLTRLFVTCAVGAAVVLLAACGLLVAVAVWPALIRPAPAPTMR